MIIKTIFILLLVIVFLSLISFFIYTLKLNFTPSKPIVKPTPVVFPQKEKGIDLSNLYYKDIPNIDLPLGIIVSKQIIPIYKQVQIIGVIDKAYQKGGRNYLDLLTLYNNKSLLLKVDLGPANFTIAEFRREWQKDRQTISQKDFDSLSADERLKLSYIEKGNTFTAEEIFEKYKNNAGKIVKLEILTGVDKFLIKNCLSRCEEVLYEFDLYAKNNTKLESVENKGWLAAKKSLEIGAVVSLSLGK